MLGIAFWVVVALIALSIIATILNSSEQEKENKKQEQYDVAPGEVYEDMRKCPNCLEFVNKNALRCKHCKSDISDGAIPNDENVNSEKECPKCFKLIHIKATRCKFCKSDISKYTSPKKPNLFLAIDEFKPPETYIHTDGENIETSTLEREIAMCLVCLTGDRLGDEIALSADTAYFRDWMKNLGYDRDGVIEFNKNSLKVLSICKAASSFGPFFHNRYLIESGEYNSGYNQNWLEAFDYLKIENPVLNDFFNFINPDSH